MYISKVISSLYEKGLGWNTLIQQDRADSTFTVAQAVDYLDFFKHFRLHLDSTFVGFHGFA
jgi:hypothetical protein